MLRSPPFFPVPVSDHAAAVPLACRIPEMRDLSLPSGEKSGGSRALFLPGTRWLLSLSLSFFLSCLSWNIRENSRAGCSPIRDRRGRNVVNSRLRSRNSGQSRGGGRDGLFSFPLLAGGRLRVSLGIVHRGEMDNLKLMGFGGKLGGETPSWNRCFRRRGCASG